MYKAYQHIEKLSNTDETDGLLKGTVYIQPKIDGTNTVVWSECGSDGEYTLHVGGRRRELSVVDDNQGCHHYIIHNENIKNLAIELHDYYIYGEFLIRNKISYYLKPAYRRFYVFDIQHKTDGHYLSYDEIKEVCEKHGVLFIPSIAKIENPTIEEIMPYLNNDYLLDKDNLNCKQAEGVVIKNYNYVNKYGRVTWGKIVNSDFKHTRPKPKIAPDFQFETELVEKYLTEDIIDKVYYRVISDNNGSWNQKLIFKFLSIVYHDFVTENIWQILKNKHKPTINFKYLETEAYKYIKSMRKELF